MTAFFYAVGVALLVIATFTKSFPVAAIGFYYIVNTPLGEFLSIDKRYWYYGFATIDLLFAAALAYIGTPWLTAASLAFFVSSMWTLATYYNAGFGHRMYDHMAAMITAVILLCTMAHAWLE